MTDDVTAAASNAEQLAAAWDRFTDQLRSMGHDVLASAPTDADRVDGLRFLLRQLAYREEQSIEFPAAERPEFFWPESPTRKVFADCPDTIYRQFNVAPGHVYRVTGIRGGSPASGAMRRTSRSPPTGRRSKSGSSPTCTTARSRSVRTAPWN